MSMEQATSMPCPPDSPWALTDLIMEYMCRRFHAELFPTTDLKGILLDVNIPTEMVCMCHFMVDPMKEPANHLPSYVIRNLDLGTEAHRASSFLRNVASDRENSCDPALVGYTHLSEPAILIAESGEVITWYLPAAVSQYNQVHFILQDVAE
ncbi:hypothetical protein PAXRUDRAFT_176067 [Paxillus rubicundulus Ve08.2h10]|uniref:Uncharacterized protein n=1 Tax=Paxillus rubicundulus Ve08.2h10 TaxID=930991 RepID=A0A0D0D2Z5_9AGAM|nr:hypothetical protein PAXRUDRAFT_176067 [Paxillus rubicundulus Ve08.2h10]